MDLPSSPGLQQLRCLNTSSTNFGTQLYSVLRGEAYEQCVSGLGDDDTLWLADYLDEVCCCIPFPNS